MNIISIVGIVLVFSLQLFETLGQATYEGCANDEAVITCGFNTTIELSAASWGPTVTTCDGVGSSPIPPNCIVNITTSMRTRCEGFATCSVVPTTTLFDTPCPQYTYSLIYTYACLLPTTITTTTTTTTTSTTTRPTTTVGTRQPVYPPGPWYPGNPWGQPGQQGNPWGPPGPPDTGYPFPRTTVTCYPGDLQINCRHDQRIQIVHVFYGRDSTNVCTNRDDRKLFEEKCDESKWASKVVNYECDGRSECYVKSRKNAFWEKCLYASGYLRVSYVCY